LGVVLNRVGRDFGEMGVDEIEMIIEEKVICKIPEDENIRSATLKRMSVIEYSPKSPSAVAHMELALKILGSYVDIRKIEDVYKEGILDKIKRFLWRFIR